ncbi:MAG: hypothetical protein JEZ11_08130 [Desulfobacterales bacterium]|nr:hypothetical protein [Desulfobacterales bacterium]
MKEKTREALAEYVRTVSGNCRELMRETERLACFVEDLLKYKDLYDTSPESVDRRYTKIGPGLMLLEDGKLYMNAVSGSTPVDDRIKRELHLFENAKTRLKDAFYRLRYCDELWFFTNETVASGYMEYEYIADIPPEGIDLTAIHAMRIVRLNWFDIVNPANNPERRGVWSPFPFIELYGQWIFSYHYPFFEDDKFKGAFVPHAKIEPMLEDSIYRSEEKMIAVHDDSTLIGVNAAAQKEFDLQPYKYRVWADITQAMNYVRNDLDLMRSESEDFVWLADGIKWQTEFDLTINGKNYTVIKERVPEIGVSLVALIDK